MQLGTEIEKVRGNYSPDSRKADRGCSPPAVMLSVADCVAGSVWLAVPQATNRAPHLKSDRCRVYHGLRVVDSVDRIISIISLSLCRPDPVTSSTTPSQYASSGVSW